MNCVNCNKETNNPKFCSRSCAATFNNTKFPKRKVEGEREKYCLWCGELVGKNASKYCSRRCQVLYRYYVYINKWKLGIVDGNKDEGCSSIIRKYLLEKYKGRCSRCGWAVANPINNIVYLEVEHLDGNSENNKEENLDLICPNCHSLTPTYKALNIGNGRRKLRMK